MGISAIGELCKDCGQPFEVGGVPTLCDCEKKQAEEQALDLKAQAYREMLDSKRRGCFRFPAMYAMSFDNSDHRDEQAEAYCNKFVSMVNHEKEQRFGIILSSPVGTGKTYLAACIANAVIDKRMTCKFTKVSEISGDITKAYGNSTDVVNGLCAYDCVVLDDFGADIGDEKLRARAYEIIDALYSSNTPFVITTNLSPAAMAADKDEFNQRTYSRILGACKIVALGGQDRRREESQAVYQKFEECEA